MNILSTEASVARAKLSRPERIVIGDEEFLRNDLAAEQQGACKRTIDRDDAKGAPFAFFAGVKYRPLKRYNEWLLANRIQRRNPPRVMRPAR
jgi:hypothetical protein